MAVATRGETLAGQVDQAASDFADFVMGLSEEEWSSKIIDNPAALFGERDEPGPAGVAAHHMAISLEPILEILRSVAADQKPKRFGPDDLAAVRAANTQLTSLPDKMQTVQRVRSQAGEAVQLIAGMTDEQLDRPTGLHGPASTEETIHRLLIGHLRWHLFSLRAVIGR